MGGNPELSIGRSVSPRITGFYGPMRAGEGVPHPKATSLIPTPLPLPSHLDTQLLALLIQVTTLKAERPCRVGDVVMLPTEFSENRFAFEAGHLLRQRSGIRA